LIKNISTEHFEETVKQLECVIIEHKNFEKLIAQYDRPDVLFIAIHLITARKDRPQYAISAIIHAFF